MKPVLVISPRDNVATALEPLEAGRRLALDGIEVTTTEAIPQGHKVALRAMAVGEPVVKYGSPIGLATSGVAAGAHVHTHNLSSSRGRGDLGEPVADAAPRLAEPPDETSGRSDGRGVPLGAAPGRGGTASTGGQE